MSVFSSSVWLLFHYVFTLSCPHSLCFCSRLEPHYTSVWFLRFLTVVDGLRPSSFFPLIDLGDLPHVGTTVALKSKALRSCHSLMKREQNSVVQIPLNDNVGILCLCGRVWNHLSGRISRAVNVSNIHEE